MAFHDAGGMNFKKFDARMEKLVGESLEVRLRAYDQLVAKFVNGATAELRAELRPGAFRRRKKTT